jgi:hypothetical protein
VLSGLQARGIPVQISLASLAQEDHDTADFAVLPDAAWQRLLARGALTVF